MSKLSEDGKPIYNESGKVMKGPKYFKLDLRKCINKLKFLHNIKTSTSYHY